MKITISIILIIWATMVSAQTDFSKYDNENGTSMMPIVKYGNSLIQSLEKKTEKSNGLEIVRIEYDNIFSRKKTSWRTLYKGVKYAIMAFGDYRVKDIDISISKYVNKEWVQVDKDKKETSYALTTVTPDETKEYKIEISVYEFKKGYSSAHYGLFITR